MSTSLYFSNKVAPKKPDLDLHNIFGKNARSSVVYHHFLLNWQILPKPKLKENKIQGTYPVLG